MNSHSSTKEGSLFGAVLLVSGCCIGAGMLGLPVLSAMTGFVPTVAMFCVSWLFMALTGLLLLEVNLWFQEDVNIVSMAEKTLGVIGKIVASGLFLFLFYSLMVAYGAASGELFSDFVWDIFHLKLPHWAGSLFMIGIFGFMVYLGTSAVDHFNRALMLGLVFSYAGLVALGASHVKTEYLSHRDWHESFFVLPAMIISFGYHNLIPSLTNYLNKDAGRLKKTLVIGSFIPLLIYLAWEWLILGLVPLNGKEGFLAALDQGDMATQALRNAVGSSLIVVLAQYFAFFAIVTSFLGVALSFVDFLADGLKMQKTTQGRLLLCFLAFCPPFLFAIIYPKVFLTALNYAGGFGAVILFGIIPALMVWSMRYRLRLKGTQVLPGGRALLLGVIAFAVFVVIIQCINEFR